jgi:hypothetical protein
VAGLLKENCLKCHGGEKVKSDFDMATREDLLRGGSHGSAVVPFDAKSSRLVAADQSHEGASHAGRAARSSPRGDRQDQRVDQ